LLRIQIYQESKTHKFHYSSEMYGKASLFSHPADRDEAQGIRRIWNWNKTKRKKETNKQKHVTSNSEVAKYSYKLLTDMVYVLAFYINFLLSYGHDFKLFDRLHA